MTQHFKCPDCSLAMIVHVQKPDGSTIAECYQHGVREMSASEVFVDAPGQRNLFGG